MATLAPQVTSISTFDAVVIRQGDSGFRFVANAEAAHAALFDLRHIEQRCRTSTVPTADDADCSDQSCILSVDLLVDVKAPPAALGDASLGIGTFTVVERFSSEANLSFHKRFNTTRKAAWDTLQSKVAVKFHQATTRSIDSRTLAPALTTDASTSLTCERLLAFGGFRPGTDPCYMQEARALGRSAARRGWSLVYGGGQYGVMGSAALAFEEQRAAMHASSLPGATGPSPPPPSGSSIQDPCVYTVIPRCMMGSDVSGRMIGQTIAVDTMSERKSIMFRLSTMVVAMPGGVGTLDELFEALTLHQLGAFRRRIGLFNVRGFFDPLIHAMRHQIKEGFLSEETLLYFVVHDDPETLLDQLVSHAGPKGYSFDWTRGNEF